jgi:hypothetical protein
MGVPFDDLTAPLIIGADIPTTMSHTDEVPAILRTPNKMRNARASGGERCLWGRNWGSKLFGRSDYIHKIVKNDKKMTT